MDHIPPFGGAPTDNYVDRNLGTGTPGSKVPAKFFNDMLAEILNVIDQAGLTPDENDLTQLYQAIAILAAGGDMFKADNLSGLSNLTAALANLGIFQPRGTSIAAAATTEIGNADSFYVRVTGNTGITSFGTGTARKWVWVEFTGTPLLTHSADLDLITGANIQVRAGDRGLFVQTDADSWSMIFFQRKDGKAISAPDPVRYARLVHELAQGSTWINYSAGSWQTVQLNTEEEDADGIVTLASNQFTLQPGTYDIEAILSVYGTGSVDPVARLYNVTDAAEVAGRGLNDKNQANITMKGFNGHRWFFTITATKTFRVEVYPKGASTTQPTFNVAGFTERMNMVHIKKYA